MKFQVSMTVKGNGDSVFTVTEEDGQETVVEVNTPTPEVWREMSTEQKNVVLRQQLEEYSDRIVNKIVYTLEGMRNENVFPMGDERVDGREEFTPDFIPDSFS